MKQKGGLDNNGSYVFLVALMKTLKNTFLQKTLKHLKFASSIHRYDSVCLIVLCFHEGAVHSAKSQNWTMGSMITHFHSLYNLLLS